jgi:hypothetical protein
METVDTSKALKPAGVAVKTLDGSVIEGKVNLGYENRMSDLFTKTDNPFIVVFDAVHLGSPKKKVLVLNKQYIVWAELLEEDQETSELFRTADFKGRVLPKQNDARASIAVLSPRARYRSHRREQ